MLFLHVLALIGVAGCAQHQDEVSSASEMQERHEFAAENRQASRLDKAKVPQDLADLIPLAEKWGIEDDLIREEFQSRATLSEKQALADALKGRNARVTEWLDSQPKSSPMSDEAAAFMYMQLGLDEMGLWADE